MTEVVTRLVEELGLWGIVVLAAAAGVEYLFPPFPGDTVTLFGAALAARGDLPWSLVWTAVTAGSGVGMAIDWRVGRWLGARADRLPIDEERSWWNPLSQERLQRFERGYRKWGDVAVLCNRFVPGVRAFFFVAAGAVGISLPRVLALGLISAGVWNGLLLGAGHAVGANLEALEAFYGEYSRIAWTVLALLVATVLAWVLIRRRLS